MSPSTQYSIITNTNYRCTKWSDTYKCKHISIDIDSIITSSKRLDAINGIAFNSARSQQLSQAPSSPTTLTSTLTLTASSLHLSDLTSKQQPSDKRDHVVQQMEQAVIEMLNAGDSRDAIATAINGIAFNSAWSQQLSQASLLSSVMASDILVAVGLFFYALASNPASAGVVSLVNSAVRADKFSSVAPVYEVVIAALTHGSSIMPSALPPLLFSKSPLTVPSTILLSVPSDMSSAVPCTVPSASPTVLRSAASNPTGKVNKHKHIHRVMAIFILYMYFIIAFVCLVFFLCLLIIYWKTVSVFVFSFSTSISLLFLLSLVFFFTGWLFIERW